MKINYKQFLTIFNKPLAEQKSLVVDVSDILKDVNINDYLDIVFVSLVEENIVLEQAVNYPLRMVIDTFKNNNNNFKNINIDFSNFKITKQAVSDLFDLLNHWPDHIRLINFCDFDKDGFKAFTQALKTAKNLPAINFEYPGTSGIPVSEQNEFISALSVCASKKIMFYFKHSTISREDFVVFSEALATADLSAKDYVILWFPKPKLRLGNFRFQQIKKEELIDKDYTFPFLQALSHLSEKKSPKKKLVLNFEGLYTEKIDRIAEFLKENPQHPRIDIRLDGEINNHSFVELLEGLSRYPNLDLSLDAESITKKGMDALTDGLKLGKFPFAFCLGMSFIPAGNVDNLIAKLCDALESGKCPQYLSLNFASDFFLDKHINQLAEAIKKKSCPLGLQLSILSDELSPKSAQVIIEMLEKNQCPSYFNLSLSSWNIPEELTKKIDYLIAQRNIKYLAESLVVIQQKFYQSESFSKISQGVLSTSLYPFLFPKIITPKETKHLIHNVEKIPQNIAKLPSYSSAK